MHAMTDFQDLTEPQRRLLLRLEKEQCFTEHFYFTGGTLLKALGIVPRESNDLDFFTFPEVDGRTYHALLGAIRSILDELFGAENVRNTERGFLIAEHGTRVECVYDIVKNIDAFVPFGKLRTSSLKDFAANKAAAFCVRDEVKDMIDIAFLTKRKGWLLADIADIAEERFRMGTISEEKLLAELIQKRDLLTVPREIFLRNPEENIAFVKAQVAFLIDHTTL